jgi:hypothetical protein
VIRRLALVTGVYVLGAAMVLGAARTVARMVLLPDLFLTLLAGLAVLGLPLALAVAWTYRPPSENGPSVDDGEG